MQGGTFHKHRGQGQGSVFSKTPLFPNPTGGEEKGKNDAPIMVRNWKSHIARDRQLGLIDECAFGSQGEWHQNILIWGVVEVSSISWVATLKSTPNMTRQSFYRTMEMFPASTW